MSPRGVCKISSPLVLVLSCLLLCGTGCTSFGSRGLMPFAGDAEQEEPIVSQQHCTVQIKPIGAKARLVEVPLTEEMRASEALNTSNALRRFRRSDVVIWRPSPRKAGEMVKLEVRFDEQTGKVKLDTDYAIHPEDRIVVAEKAFTIFDEAYNALLGPVLGRIGR